MKILNEKRPMKPLFSPRSNIPPFPIAYPSEYSTTFIDLADKIKGLGRKLDL
jgi:hypothetical protein